MVDEVDKGYKYQVDSRTIEPIIQKGRSLKRR